MASLAHNLVATYASKRRTGAQLGQRPNRIGTCHRAISYDHIREQRHKMTARQTEQGS
jgi:hypothetical protein